MTLQAFYESMGVDINEIINRFSGEERIRKYLGKFLEDGTYDTLLQAFENKDNEEAFRAAHTLKGIALNLSLRPLYQESNMLTEALRDSKCQLEDVQDLLEHVKREHEEVTGKIKEIL